MKGDGFFYVMIVVIALIGVGLFAIPVKAHEAGPAKAQAADLAASAPMLRP
jgi:hypothetical protein